MLGNVARPRRAVAPRPEWLGRLSIERDGWSEAHLSLTKLHGGGRHWPTVAGSASPAASADPRCVARAVRRSLRRWPDMRQLARSQVRSVAAEAGISLDRSREVRHSVSDAIAFYRDRVDHDALAREFEINIDHRRTLAWHIQRLDERITHAHHRAYPDDVLLSIPGTGPVVASVVRHRRRRPRLQERQHLPRLHRPHPTRGLQR